MAAKSCSKILEFLYAIHQCRKFYLNLWDYWRCVWIASVHHRCFLLVIYETFCIHGSKSSSEPVLRRPFLHDLLARFPISHVHSANKYPIKFIKGQSRWNNVSCFNIILSSFIFIHSPLWKRIWFLHIINNIKKNKQTIYQNILHTPINIFQKNLHPNFLKRVIFTCKKRRTIVQPFSKFIEKL